MTSSQRIPPSLAWLINKKARLEGELAKIRAVADRNGGGRLLRMERLNARLSEVKEEQAAADKSVKRRMAMIRQQIDAVVKTLELHEIQINAASIKTHPFQGLSSLIL